MPELDTITVKGFKSIASIEKLKLGAINVLIGPNGSGKSNFIGVFSFLHAIREGQLQDYVARAGGADKVLHFGSKVTQAIEIHVFFLEKVRQYHITLGATETDQLYPSSRNRLHLGRNETLSRQPYERERGPTRSRGRHQRSQEQALGRFRPRSSGELAAISLSRHEFKFADEEDSGCQRQPLPAAGRLEPGGISLFSEAEARDILQSHPPHRPTGGALL